MIRLAFVPPRVSRLRQVTAEAIVLRCAQIERHPEAESIAFAVGGGWQIDKERFTRAECRDSVLCLFEADGKIGERRGPFRGLAMTERMLDVRRCRYSPAPRDILGHS